MLCYIITKDKSTTVLLKESNTVISLFNQSLMVVYLNNQYYLRLPHELKYVLKNEIKHGSSIVIEDSKSKEKARLYFSNYDTNFYLFDKYCVSFNTITIGSKVDDDIYIQDSNLNDIQLIYHLNSLYLEDKSNSYICSVNNKPINNISLKPGDTVQICNLVIIIHPEFLMINSCENVYFQFSKYIEDNKEYPLQEYPIHEIYYHYRSIHLHNDLNVLLDEPFQNKSREFNSLVFTMGPALTMSSASLLSGMFSLYNGYLNGRELIELLPTILLPSVMLLSALFWNPFQRFHEKRKDKKFNQKRLSEYKDYLDEVSNDIEIFKDNYKKEYDLSFPELKNIYLFQNEEEMFQRTDSYDDYLMFRLGIGNDRLNVTYESKFQLKKNDEVRKLIEVVKEEKKEIENTVITFSLLEYPKVTYINSSFESFLNRILLQITSWYSKEKFAIGFITDNNWLEEHKDYLNIPHVFNNTNSFRYIACSEKEVDSLFTMQRNEEKYLFLFVLKYSLARNLDTTNVATIYLSDGTYLPTNTDLFIQEENGIGVIEKENYSTSYQIDDCNFDINNYFIQNNRYQISNNLYLKNKPTLFDLFSVNNIKDLNIKERYLNNSNQLIAPLGFDSNGEILNIDLNEKGNGPHGLIAGTTGSGKSELIITLILSLAINYSPDNLQFVLIDFKGGGVASVLSNSSLKLPHIIGILDNLDSSEMDRALSSFKNECKKRESLFQKLTNITHVPINNLSSYQKEWTKETSLPYLSDLIIIIDEFAELKLEYPDFLQDLISIARIGRSLGIHLILVTQKPAGIVNEQIWSNCHFKICLKVQEKQDSREVLHRDDAANIYDPGEFYFLSDDHFSKCKCGYANASEDTSNRKIEIIDYRHEILYKNELHKQVLTQAQSVIKEICNITKGYQTSSLWLSPLEVRSCKNIKYDKAYIGMIDNYYQNTQEDFYIETSSNSYLIVSSSSNDRMSFLYTLLYAVFKTVNKNDEIYVIDDLDIYKSYFDNMSQLISIFSSDNKELTKNVFKRLQENKDSSIHTTLIITDIYSFFQNNDQNPIYLHTLLETYSRHNITIILFSANSNGLNYRDKLLIQNKISLKNENLQDLQSLFEMPVKKKIKNSYEGMIYKENSLLFKFIKVDEEDLENVIQDNYEIYHGIKPYILESLPSHIFLNDYLGEDYYLGKDINDYSDVVISKRNNLFVIATYENELFDFYQVYNKKYLNCFYMLDTKNILNKVNDKESYIFLVTIDEYSKIMKEVKHIPYLYVGVGFHEQYTIRYLLNKKLERNQGLLVSDTKRGVIQLVE